MADEITTSTEEEVVTSLSEETVDETVVEPAAETMDESANEPAVVEVEPTIEKANETVVDPTEETVSESVDETANEPVAKEKKKKKSKKEKREEEDRPLFTSTYVKILDLFSNKFARAVFFAILLSVAVFLMFMTDIENSFRRETLTFLDDSTVVQDFMAFFGIEQFNVGVKSWYYFFAVFTVSILVICTSLFASSIANAHYERRKDKVKSESGCKARVTFFVYLFVLLLCAAGIVIAWKIGWFEAPPEVDVGSNKDVFLNLAYSLLLFLFFGIVIPLALIIAYYAISLFFTALAWALYAFRTFLKDIEAKEHDRLERAKERNRKENEIRHYGDEELDKRKGSDGGFGGGEDEVIKMKSVDPDRDRQIFPILVTFDEHYTANPEPEIPRTDMTLEEFVLQFQSYACNQRKIFYELPVLRSFLAGMATSRLIILEGLSGTGKSLLPRMFSEFTGSEAFFTPVQSTWRDKTDVLGYYSEFTKIFRTKDFLNRLYESSYYEKTNLMILDEMNLSRIEYYFADFLSVLEFPSCDWKVKVIDSNVSTNMPNKLGDGYITIPENTWFIGTANTDDSTFTITDKVYDRAIVLTFNERFSPVASDYKSDPIQISAAELSEMFKTAMETEEYRLSEEETEKFLRLCDFIRDQFDVRFGNRILNQINRFVPVYVALGGSKTDALDFMLARKVLRKLNGVYDDYIKESIALLTKYLNKEYGMGTFSETEALLSKIMKRLG